MRYPLSRGLLRCSVAGLTVLLIAGTTACAASSIGGSDVARSAAADSSRGIDIEITVESTSLETESVENPGTWVPTSLIYQGGPARLSLDVTTTQSTEVEASVSLPDGNSTIIGTATTQLPPGESTITIPLNTDQSPWLDASAPDHFNVTLNASTSDSGEQSLEVPATIAPRPVIFVHGMWQDATWWNPYLGPSGFLATTNPTWKGFAVDSLDTGSPLRPLSSVNTVQQNADLTWEYISERMRESNAHHVDVVAHSLGGVITRRLLHDPNYGLNAQEAIHTVILLGVPDGGSPCSDKIPTPANREITITAMTEFNGMNPGYPGVQSTALYSDHWATTCFTAESGDSMVPAWSSTAQPTTKSQRITPGVSHANMTKDPRLYRDFVQPLLQDPPR